MPEKLYAVAYRDYEKCQFVVPPWNHSKTLFELYAKKESAEEAAENHNLKNFHKAEVIEVSINLPEMDDTYVEVTMDEVYEKFGCKVVIKQDAKDCPSCSD